MINSIVDKLTYKVVNKILPFFVLLIFFFIILIIVCIDLISLKDNNFKDIAISSIATMTNISILNIASLLIIVQLNYQKYESSYLIIEILKSPFLFITTFLPAILVIFSTSFLISSELKFLPLLFLLLSFSSTVLLFYYVNTFLETNIVLKKIFEKTTKNDFDKYKIDKSNFKETSFDAILKIVLRVVKSDDSSISKTLFFNLASWIMTNRLLLKP